MGTKKTTTTKIDAPSKRAATPAKAVKVATPAKPGTTGKTAAPGKVAAPRKTVVPPKRRTVKAAKTPAFTHDDLALRAYFVSEARRAAGLPGDERSDWLEAERQLTVETT